MFAILDPNRGHVDNLRDIAMALATKYDQDAAIYSDGEVANLIGKDGTLYRTFDAVVFGPDNVAKELGKTKLGGAEFSLISKHNSNHANQRGKIITRKGR